MTSAMLQIKTAYEQEKMSPSQIAEDQDLEEVAIKAILSQCSSVYRKDCGRSESEAVENGLDFSNDQLRAVNNMMFDLALTATHPDGTPDNKVRADLCKYVRDDKKGRKEVKQLIRDTGNFNIFTINQQIQQARQKVEKLVAGPNSQKFIEVT